MTRILALDWGEKRIGVAFSEGYLAQPHSVIKHNTKQQAYTEIEKLIKALQVEILLMGLPKSLNPAQPIGSQAKSILRHRRNLKKQISIPIEMVDETYSSITAAEILQQTGRKNKTPLDAAAAAVILQTYLDQQNSA